VGDLDKTDLITSNTFFIGVYPGLTDAHLNYVATTFEDFFRSRA
jgi:CDP-6-deoxy-D-xylo-4-hexulose-3-dehydrase